MAYAMKNSLFVRNLSPDVSEATLREVFGICDEIVQITFKPYNTLSNQFFAQVDFKSSLGITEGSKLSGNCILGVPCVCGVIDPLASSAEKDDGDLSLAMDPAAIQAEFARRTKEAEDDQKFRTVHISGIGMDMTYEAVRTLCKNFGEVERLRLDEDDFGQRFALCEFRERGPAHVCKMQQQYLVGGKVLRFTESQTMVDECAFAERTVQFEDTYLHAIAMRSQLTQPGQLNEKLKRVRMAAESIMPPSSQPGWGFSRDPPTEEKEKKKKKEKKEGKEKKAKKEKKQKEGEEGGNEKKEKKEKKDKKQKKEKKDKNNGAAAGEQAENQQGQQRNGSENADPDRRVSEPGAAAGRRRVRYKRRRRPGEKKGDHKHSKRKTGESSQSQSPSKKAELVEDESDGPIDLDEVEVVQGTELVIMGSGSSSSSSSSSDDAVQASPGPGGVDRKGGTIELDLDQEGVVELEGEAAAARSKARSRSPSSESLS